MKGGDNLLQSDRTAIAQALLEAVEMLQVAAEMMNSCATDEHCGGENLTDNLAKVRAFLQKVKA